MILLVLFAHIMRRMLFMYFSIVRRSAACASRVSESASLMITTERLELLHMQNLTLELLLGVEVDLLRLSNLLEDILDNDAVVHSNVGGGELNVVVGLHDVDIELAVGGGDKDTLINAELRVR